jgi:hypothetical protein
MYLSVATTHQPATDLGFLLHKHPGRVHETELSFGKALVFYPEATEARCEAALVLDVDPVALVRGKGRGEGLIDQYVNDRPYAASSFLAVALGRTLRTAMTGTSRERQDLAEREIPLEAVVTPLPARGGGERLVRDLFGLGCGRRGCRLSRARTTSRSGCLGARGCRLCSTTSMC